MSLPWKKKKNGVLLSEHEGVTGEYWPEVVVLRPERNVVRTKTTDGQNSPVRLKQARLGFWTEKHPLAFDRYNISMETVRVAKPPPRNKTNQNIWI